MQIDDFLTLVHSRRSVRRFTPDAVPDEAIQKILEAGRWAMSGANAQPWEFVVVRDTDMRAKLVESWFGPHKEMYAIEQTRTPEYQMTPLRRFSTEPPFKDAPVLIVGVVVLGDRRTYQATVLGANFLVNEGAADAIYLKNMANATQNLHLAAAAAGLGSMWASVPRVWGEAIKRILDIPAVLEVHTIVALGYPAYQPGTASRRELADMVHYDRYDRSKHRSGEDILEFIKELRKKTETPYRQGYAPESK